MHAEKVRPALLDTAALVEHWLELGRDPTSPDNYELSEYGDVVVSPKPTTGHQSVVAWVLAELNAQLPGRAFADLALVTRSAGIRVPDAAWLPTARIPETYRLEGPLESSPPLVVEVLSPSNSRALMAFKIEAYLESGVQEVVVIDLHGQVIYHHADGTSAQSVLGLSLAPPPEMFA